MAMNSHDKAMAWSKRHAAAHTTHGTSQTGTKMNSNSGLSAIKVTPAKTPKPTSGKVWKQSQNGKTR